MQVRGGRTRHETICGQSVPGRGFKCAEAGGRASWGWRRHQEAGWWTRTEPKGERPEGGGWTSRPGNLLPVRILALIPSEIGAHGRVRAEEGRGLIYVFKRSPATVMNMHCLIPCSQFQEAALGLRPCDRRTSRGTESLSPARCPSASEAHSQGSSRSSRGRACGRALPPPGSPPCSPKPGEEPLNFLSVALSPTGTVEPTRVVFNAQGCW